MGVPTWLCSTGAFDRCYRNSEVFFTQLDPRAFAFVTDARVENHATVIADPDGFVLVGTTCKVGPLEAVGDDPLKRFHQAARGEVDALVVVRSPDGLSVGCAHMPVLRATRADGRDDTGWAFCYWASGLHFSESPICLACVVYPLVFIRAAVAVFNTQDRRIHHDPICQAPSVGKTVLQGKGPATTVGIVKLVRSGFSLERWICIDALCFRSIAPRVLYVMQCDVLAGGCGNPRH